MGKNDKSQRIELEILIETLHSRMQEEPRLKNQYGVHYKLFKEAMKKYKQKYGVEYDIGITRGYN